MTTSYKNLNGKIKDFIWTKDDSLTKDFCQHVIDKFDSDDRKTWCYR